MSETQRREGIISENDNSQKSVEVEADFDISYTYDFIIEEILAGPSSPSSPNIESSYSFPIPYLLEDRVEEFERVPVVMEPPCPGKESIFCTAQISPDVPNHCLFSALSYHTENTTSRPILDTEGKTKKGKRKKIFCSLQLFYFIKITRENQKPRMSGLQQPLGALVLTFEYSFPHLIFSFVKPE